MTRLLIAAAADGFVATLAAVLERNARIEIVGRAKNGAEAVALAGRLEPDLVLMDLGMPDGVAATPAIAMLAKSPSVIVVSEPDHAERALEARFAGAVDVIRKSRIGDELLDAVTSAARAQTSANRNGG